MIKTYFLIPIFLAVTINHYAQTSILDSVTKEPVSFATVSFGNGNGIFADDEGVFRFTKELYPDIDSLFISALGYEKMVLTTNNLADSLFVNSKEDQLRTVVITSRRKFKNQKVNATIHNDYYKCWLPTIESEIAVFFPKTDDRITKIATVDLPIKLEASDWDKRKRASTKVKSFSTLFLMHFYENDNGVPGKTLTYDQIAFRVTEDSSSIFSLDVRDYDIYMPDNGLFVSIQVLGYTDQTGKLLPNKKYREVKTPKGIVKISTTFRPLLPFTDEIKDSRTFVKRIFLSGNTWVKFEKGKVQNSNLLRTGQNNYGMGLGLQVYKEK